MKPLLVVVGATLLAVPVRPSGRAPGPVAPDSTVLIKGFGFKPQTLEVAVGVRVRWDNEDEIQHTVTADADSGAAPAFDGVMAGKGQSFSVTFDRAGTYAYHCARHTFMRGEIRVITKGAR